MSNFFRYSNCLIPLGFLSLTFACSTQNNEVTPPYPSFSGVYPHLAMYNSEPESGIGAVVPWADRLWAVTYGPHVPFGSDDKLYEITPDLQQIVREESIGGTPANRMIHRESNQLFIGPYAIDENRNVRAIPYTQIPGRPTGTARHLTDPENKVYHGTMEEGFYEIDVHTLEAKLLYEDLNVTNRKAPEERRPELLANLDGAHGKGLYSGQGVLVYSNNGETGQKALEQFDIESGSLSEWDGKNWKTVRRNQFVEVTGPGGIYGNSNPETDPIWATGWDHKSLLVAVRDHGKWSFYRLPKASHSYDGAHGWNTEWPRIRDVGTPEKPDYLMTMHGMFWQFPGSFTSQNSAGIRPRSAYLKVIGDFTRWKNQLVFGCDDSAQKEFLNKRKLKGGIEGPGQSNSNLWFTNLDTPDQLGPNTAEGAVWLNEVIQAEETSEPFLFTGWDHRSAWIANQGTQETEFIFEVDKKGDNQWSEILRIKVPAQEESHILFSANQTGEWVRVKTTNTTKVTLHFSYTDTRRFKSQQNRLLNGLARTTDPIYQGGLLYGLGKNRRALGVLAGKLNNGVFQETGYYELDGAMNLVKKDDDSTATFIREQFAIPKDVVTVEKSSVLVVDDKGRRWRLPLGDPALTQLTNLAATRICREVATERDLLNLHGTFYELPAENADGFAKVRPVATHNLPIHDYASYRGLLVLTGVNEEQTNSDRIIRSADGGASVWVGTIDDLWEFGKPVGEGGPWKDDPVVANIPSDPYLIGFYDQKTLQLSHGNSQPVTFKIQVEPIGHGPWMTFKEVTVKNGETFEFTFPDGFQSRWIRFVADQNCKATAWLTYR